jgi:hypothetical protein
VFCGGVEGCSKKLTIFPPFSPRHHLIPFPKQQTTVSAGVGYVYFQGRKEANPKTFPISAQRTKDRLLW